MEDKVSGKEAILVFHTTPSNWNQNYTTKLPRWLLDDSIQVTLL